MILIHDVNFSHTYVAYNLKVTSAEQIIIITKLVDLLYYSLFDKS